MKIRVTGAAGFRPPYFVLADGAAIHLPHAELSFGAEA